MSTYSMHCASARHRLQVSIPATIEHRVNRHGDSSTAVSVAECVHHYIGTMDTLKLNMAAKDQIAPCLSTCLSVCTRSHSFQLSLMENSVFGAGWKDLKRCVQVMSSVNMKCDSFCLTWRIRTIHSCGFLVDEPIRGQLFTSHGHHQTDFDESVKSFRPYYYAEQARVHFLLGREERIHLCDDLRVLRL